MSHKKLLKKGQLIDGYWCSLYPEALNQVSVIKCNPNYPWRTEVSFRFPNSILPAMRMIIEDFFFL